MRWNRRTLAWIVTVLAVAPLLAEDQPAAPAAPPEMSAEEQAMMDAMIRAGTPGSEHAWLASMAGSWEFEGTSWMKPGGPPTSFNGTAERSMILGGRVMQEKVVSAFGGMPFEGLGTMGYDNVTKKWWGTWNDNMTTGMMTTSGHCKDGKCEYLSTAADPLTGKMSSGRMTSETTGDHEHVVMYAAGPDGKEFKAMEFHYQRKK